MKKQLLFLLLLANLAVSSQNNKGQLWVSSGVSDPLGEFKAPSRIVWGWAKTGVNIRLNYQYKFNKYFGITLFLHGAINDYNADEVRKLIPTTNIEAGSWKTTGLNIGPVFIWPISKKVQLEARPTIGLNIASTPEIIFSNSTGYYIKFKSGNTPTFVYGFGVGAKFFLTDHWFIPVHLDFMASKATFDNLEVTELNKTIKYKHEQQMNTFNSSVGFGYLF